MVNLGAARVVGTGSIGSRYLRVLAGMLEVKPVAVPISGRLRDARLADIADVENISGETWPRVDLVVIASATESHLQFFQSFRDTARVALVEKPLAASAEALDVVHPWPRASSAFVAAPLRFTKGFQEVERILPHVGRITSANVVCRSWLPSWRPESDHRQSYSADATYGGVLLDLIHETDYCLRLFGSPLQVGAVLRTGTAIEVPSDASATMFWRFEEFDLKMDLDFLSRPARRELSISGTRMSVVWNVLDASVAVYDHDQGTCQVTSFPEDLNRDLLLRREILATVDSRLARRSCTFEEARLSLQVCDVARRSSHTGGRLMELGAST